MRLLNCGNWCWSTTGFRAHRQRNWYRVRCGHTRIFETVRHAGFIVGLISLLRHINFKITRRLWHIRTVAGKQQCNNKKEANGNKDFYASRYSVCWSLNSFIFWCFFLRPDGYFYFWACFFSLQHSKIEVACARNLVHFGYFTGYFEHQSLQASHSRPLQN